MSSKDIQAKFFQLVKERIDPNISFVDEVADMLELSTDSAYRRMRGETSLTFEELALLSKRFNISVDSLMESETNELTFQFQPLKEDGFNFIEYLKYIEQNMKLIEAEEDKEVIYIANEIPLFHLLHVPEVASFKLFFWQKTILDFSQFRDQRFKLGKVDEQVNELSRSLRDLYCRIPSTEIYHSETVDTTLKQIEYYFDSGYFEVREEAMHLLNKVEVLIKHIRNQCEVGYKFRQQEDGQAPEFTGYRKQDNYTVFHNDVLHTDNTILVRLGSRYLSFLTSNGISSLSTMNEKFYHESVRAIGVLKRRATLISGTSEKERNRVFENYFRKIERLRARLDSQLA